MLGLTLVESLSALGAIAVIALALVLILRPLKVHLTIHDKKKEEEE
jgi:cell division protein FtsW (lipid II flippase)